MRQGWDGPTSIYSSGDIVVGSDNEVYVSVIDDNVGHDPTTDGGVTWKVANTSAHAQTGDLTFTPNTVGPVLSDQSNGHTYRVITTNGTLGVQQVA